MYRTKSEEWCRILNGELLVIHCPKLFEVHTSSLFLRNQILPFYKAFYQVTNETLITPQTYSKMDTGSLASINLITYLVAYNQSFQVLNYREVSNMGTTLVQTYRLSQLDLGFKNLIEVNDALDYKVCATAALREAD